MPSVSVPGSQTKHRTGKEGSEQKPQRTKLAKLLKESFTPETLAEEILQMKISVPVGQILSMKEMQKLWFSPIPAPSDQPTSSVAVNNIGTERNRGSYSSQSSDPRLLYIAATPKAKAVVAGK